MSPTWRPVMWTAERMAVLARDYPAGVALAEIHAAICALPGPAPTKHYVSVKATEMKLRRPAGYVPSRAPSAPASREPRAKQPRGAGTPSLAKADATPARPTTRRRCLGCSQGFDSDGAGNRVCDGCKATADWRSGGISEHRVMA